MKIRTMTRCALFAALMAVCSWLSVPMGNGAVTMQTLGLFLTLGLLGGVKGCGAVLIYLCLGMVGLPVFSGFQGGLGVLLGPTGGYIWGFLVSAVLYWSLEKHLPLWLNLILCQLICYLCGILWYSLAYSHDRLWLLVLPYLIPDGIKLCLSLLLIQKLRRLAA
jgi:biotin transport system substrate-specific component